MGSQAQQRVCSRRCSSVRKVQPHHLSPPAHQVSLERHIFAALLAAASVFMRVWAVSGVVGCCYHVWNRVDGIINEECSSEIQLTNHSVFISCFQRYITYWETAVHIGTFTVARTCVRCPVPRQATSFPGMTFLTGRDSSEECRKRVPYGVPRCSSRCPVRDVSKVRRACMAHVHSCLEAIMKIHVANATQIC